MSVEITMSYASWMKSVEIFLNALYGVSVADLNDFFFLGLYGIGVSPKTAAKQAFLSVYGKQVG